ncbi:MAG: hypothetical protein R3F14_33400 [Polyangiaceae bacterium]
MKKAEERAAKQVVPALEMGAQATINPGKKVVEQAERRAAKQAVPALEREATAAATAPTVTASGAALVDPQLDANLVIALINTEDPGHAAAVAYVQANKAAGLSAEDARVAATALLRNEKLATNDLQFFKRAKDLGLKVEYVGGGAAAKKAAAYVPTPVVIPSR